MKRSSNLLLLLVLIIQMSCNKKIKYEKMDIESDTIYTVIWKYKVKPEFKEKFEQEYGQYGTWATLFAKSESYKGSLLHENGDERFSYLLFDTWTDEETYENFKRDHQKEYNKISAGFEYLYDSEEKIGSFDSIK